jgi:RNA-directed DNA polymerase
MQNIDKITKDVSSGESHEASLNVHVVAPTPRSIASLRTNLSLMEEILERENMFAALKRVMRNKGCAGEDGMEVSELKPYLKDNWLNIKTGVLNGNYRPSRVLRVEIPKANGGKRVLGVPTVIDRLIQQASAQVLQKYIDPEFSHHSYGFRPKRSAHQAVLEGKEFIKMGLKQVVDIDLEKYFDTVNHDRLMTKLQGMISDQRVLDLIRKFLNSGIDLEGGVGVPQGSPISPLLSNIYLDELDKELEHRGHKFVRYADDCRIFVRSNKAAVRVMASVSHYLAARMKLRVNEAKSNISVSANILGFAIVKSKIWVSRGNIEGFKDKVRQLTKIRGGKSLREVIKSLKPVINGWYEYFKIQESKGLFKDLDGWIRRRIRAIYYKQLKHGATRVGEFMKQGISYERAYKTAFSSKKAWHMSRMDVMHEILNSKKLKGMGLVSLAR